MHLFEKQSSFILSPSSVPDREFGNKKNKTKKKKQKVGRVLKFKGQFEDRKVTVAERSEKGRLFSSK